MARIAFVPSFGWGDMFGEPDEVQSGSPDVLQDGPTITLSLPCDPSMMRAAAAIMKRTADLRLDDAHWFSREVLRRAAQAIEEQHLIPKDNRND